MPTVFSHPAPALAFGAVLRPRPTAGLLLLGALFSVLPDLDVLAFSFGIPYAHPLGHRGFTHSLPFAILLGTVAAAMLRRWTDLPHSFTALALYLTATTASHGLLDAMTSGGLGVGFFIPFDSGRYFFPWRPIRVSPIGVSGFLDRGLPVLISELWYVWLPAVGVAGAGALTHLYDRR